MKKSRFLSFAVAVMMALCVNLPLQALAAKPGDIVEEKFTISAGENFYLVYVEFKLSDGLVLEGSPAVTSTLGPVVYNAATGKAIAYDAGMATSGGASSVTFTVKAKVKDGVTTDQTISFSNVQYISSALKGSADLANVIKIGDGTAVSADVNGDGRVTMRDVMIVLYAFLDNTPVAEVPKADLNADGRLTMRDVMIVLYAFLDS